MLQDDMVDVNEGKAADQRTVRSRDGVVARSILEEPTLAISLV